MSRVRIVGLAPSNREAGKNRPDDMWGLPWDPLWPRYSMLFEMHDRELWDHKREYVKQLQRAEVPILMQEEHADIPNSVAYPFDDLLKYDSRLDYFNSSIAYMLAMALHETYFDRVEVFGVDNAPGNEEWAKERPCNEWWIGRLIGGGVDVWIHPDSSLLVPQLDVMYDDQRQNYVGRYGKLR